MKLKKETEKTHYKTLKVRVKDKHAKLLLKQAASVNFVWNYLNDLSYRSIREKGVFLSYFDFHKYITGASKEIDLGMASIEEVAKEYATRRKQFKKIKLNWRKTRGVRKSLGWIPFKGSQVKWKNGQVQFNGSFFSVFDSYGLSKYKFKSGSFNEDARGRWYFNVVVEVPQIKSKGTSAVGIDLGCKESVTTSTGEKLQGRNYRKLEGKLGIAQRARNKNRVRAIHAKIKNKRKDELQKLSTKLVKENAAVFVGNVSSKGLTRTKMAKSVLDAGWGMFKTMLEYKCAHAGVVFEEVNESYTTQTCSCCGVISDNSPKGRAGLGIREWLCVECGTLHDRDINAAMNILYSGSKYLKVEENCTTVFGVGTNPLVEEKCSHINHLV